MSFGYSVGDFIAALEIIHRVTKKVANAPKEYQRIRDEVTILGLAIKEVAAVPASASAPTQSSTPTETQTTTGRNNPTTTSTSGPSSSGPGAPPATNSNISAPALTSPLQQIARSCLDVLVRLERELDKYVDLGAKAQGSGTSAGRKSNPLTALVHRAKKGWRRFRFDPEEITKVRVQLMSHLQSFSTVQMNENSYKITSIDQGVNHLLTGQQQASQSMNSINRGVNEISLESRNQARAVNAIHGHLRDEDYKKERKKILDWISPVDYSDTHQDFINRRQPGTGEWFSNSAVYQTWLNGRSPGAGGRTLFCPGIPGAGKTMLTAIAIDQLTAQFRGTLGDFGIAYIYFSYQKEGSQQELDLLASLLRQLAGAKAVLPKELENLYKECTKTHKYRPNKAQILDGLDVVTGTFSRVFILLDALDECDRYVLEPFLQELFALQDRRGIVSLFATSRFIPEIQVEFERRSSLSIKIRASKEDVRRYLEGQMRGLRNFALGEEDLQRQVTEKIVESVQGMFLLAQLHFRTVRARKTKNAVLETLAKLESGSNAYEYAYEQAMERIKGQEDDCIKFAMRALTWITCAKRPLSTQELRHALVVQESKDSIDENDIPKLDGLVSWCAGLVTVDEQSGIIRLVHYTTQEYFRREKDKWFPDAETQMATSCLKYISFPVFESGACSDPNDFMDREASNPLYVYAACNWGHHLRPNWLAGKNLLNEFLKSSLKAEAAAEAVPNINGYNLGSSYDDPYPRLATLPGLTGLHLMVYFGLHEAIEFFLGRSRADTPVTEDGQTLLGWAAVHGHDQVAKILISKGADIEKRDNTYRTTPLLLASYHGQTEVVKLLLQNGANPRARDMSGRDSLLLAAHNGHQGAVKAILENCKETLLSFDLRAGNSALMYASGNHHLEVVRLILQHLPDETFAKMVHLNKVNKNKQTALSRAVWSAINTNRRMEVIQLLLDAGANPNIGCDTSSRLRPSLIRPIHRHEPDLLRLLLSRGARTETTNSWGWTPLMFAVYYIQTACVDKKSVSELPQEVVEIFHILLEYGADINGVDILGRRTPLIHAILPWEPIAEGLVLKLVKLIVAAGADLEAQDITGWTALRYAIHHKYQTVVDFLVSHGAKVTEGVELDVNQAMMDPNRNGDRVRAIYLSNGFRMRGG